MSYATSCQQQVARSLKDWCHICSSCMACNDFELDTNQRPLMRSVPSTSTSSSSSGSGSGIITGGGHGLPPRSPLIKMKRLAPSSSNGGSSNTSLSSPLLTSHPAPGAAAALPLSLEDRARSSMRDEHQRRWAAAVAYRSQCAGGLWPPYAPPLGPLTVAPGAYQCRSCHLPLGDVHRLSATVQRLGLCELCQDNIRHAELYEMTMMGYRDMQDDHLRLQVEYKRLLDENLALQRQTDLFGNASVIAGGSSTSGGISSLRIDTSDASPAVAIAASAGIPSTSMASNTLSVPSTPIGARGASPVPPSPMPQVIPVVLW